MPQRQPLAFPEILEHYEQWGSTYGYCLTKMLILRYYQVNAGINKSKMCLSRFLADLNFLEIQVTV